MDEEKVISIEKHIPKLKEARKKKSNRRFIFYLVIFLILLFVLIYLQTPLSKVKDIKVSGNDFLAKEDIASLDSLSIGQNIWLVDKDKVEAELKNIPYIKKVKVSRLLPRTVKIQIEEQEIIGYVQNKDNLYLPILKNGDIQEDDTFKQPTDRIIFHEFEEREYLNRLVSELEEVPPDLLNNISEIIWQPTEKNKYQIQLFMNDGYEVVASIRDFKSKIALYPSIVEQLDEGEKGIIHLGVGAYFEKDSPKKKNKKK